MAMHNPPHPGGIVKRQCLEPFGLTVTRADEGLGVTRQALSQLVNERSGISVEMAIRLSKAFSSTPETWLGMQMAWDLWQARERACQIMVEKFAAAQTTRSFTKDLIRQARGGPEKVVVAQLAFTNKERQHLPRFAIVRRRQQNKSMRLRRTTLSNPCYNWKSIPNSRT